MTQTPKLDLDNPQPGIYHNVPLADYLALEAFSKSCVKHVLRSPAHLRAYLDSDKPVTPALLVGSAIDALTFDQEKFCAEYVLRPLAYPAKDGTDKPWNANATYCKEWLADNSERGLAVLSPEQYGNIVRTVRAICGNPDVAAIMRGGKAQVTLVWRDEETGALCKGRPDYIRPDRIVDLKSTKDASNTFRTFGADFIRFDYHCQCAMYQDGWQALTGELLPFSVIAAEKEPPFASRVYDITPEQIEWGRIRYRRALQIYADCCERGEWPGYAQDERTLQTPEWGEETPDLDLSGVDEMFEAKEAAQ